MSVYGREVAESMIVVDGVDLPDGPLSGVTGLVSHPETTRAGREYLSTYVNSRYVRAKTAHDAVVDAYGTQLAPDRYPFAVLFLGVPAGDVDVNVHPRKMEVRFIDDEGVREQVRTAVEDALLEEGLLRSTAPRGRSQPEQTEITPESGSESATDDPATDSMPGDRPEQSTDEEASPATSADTASGRTADGPDGATEPRSDGQSTPSDAAAGEPTRPATTDDAAEPAQSDPDRKFAGGHDQTHLGDAPETNHDTLPSMRILGQLHDTYVVAETADGLVLIDQHAADERVNYERLKRQFAGETTTQALADPVELEMTAREVAVFEKRNDALASLGFHTARTGERTVELRTLPGIIADSAGPDIVRDVLSAFVGESEAAATVEAAADELLGDFACYPSITGNTSLTEGSVRDLLAALDDCDDPYTCPHGRPTVIEVDFEELEDRFERDYPGHAGRRK